MSRGGRKQRSKEIPVKRMSAAALIVGAAVFFVLLTILPFSGMY